MKNFVLFLFLILCSCTNLDEVENRLDVLEQEVTDIKNAVKILQTAYKDGKIINSVNPLQSKNGGWIITFSDGDSIELQNGKDGVNVINGLTPYLLIDQDKYWCVSYDNGNTFTRLMDDSGNFIKAIEGISIKVLTDKDKHYIFVMYNESDPSTIIDVIKTPYKSDDSKVINSIKQDDFTNIITISLEDGSSYTFNKEYAVPSSIAILTTNKVILGAGTTSYVEFRVNPSNAQFNYNVDSQECNIELDFINKTRNSYVTTPSNYKLSKVEQVYDAQGVMKKGQYRAYITDLNISNNYIEDAALVLTVNNKNNEKIQVSSSAINITFEGNIFSSFSFKKNKNNDILYDVHASIDDKNIIICSPLVLDVKNLVATFNTNGEKVLVNNIEQISGITVNDFTNPVTYTIISASGDIKQYDVSVTNTGLPVVVIETQNKAIIPPKTEEWLGNTKIKVINTDGTVTYESDVDNIRGRGNTTWGYPKKPYALKLNKKASILGMPKHKRWVLLANWMDRTMMRNSVAFQISKLTDLDWTPRGEFVEVILNGSHIGNYYLCEQIKIDENRVNINELKESDVDGDDITGGYLMELDVYYDEVNKFKSSIRNLPYMFKEPDEEALNVQQFDYMKNYINTLENALYDDLLFSTRKYEDYLDMDSFIDWWLVQELTRNWEPNHPKSTYMHKDKLGKLKAGPVWDFDFGTFSPISSGFYISNAIYYNRLFEDLHFKAKVKTRWELLKANLQTVSNFIEEEKNKLLKSADLNIKLWPISSRVNGDETMNFEDAVKRMKEAYENRLQVIGNAINNM